MLDTTKVIKLGYHCMDLESVKVELHSMVNKNYAMCIQQRYTYTHTIKLLKHNLIEFNTMILICLPIEATCKCKLQSSKKII